MSPLGLPYLAAVTARNALYDRGVLKQQRLRRPVISIGNISAGGSGKTPFTILLGSLLKQRGLSVDVLSRGYRRKTTGTQVVDHNGTAADYGDEPLLIAKSLRAPVIVSARRFDGGTLAEQRFRSDYHLLDDGFQHRQLARDFDIVMLNLGDLEDSMLPLGRLREPVSSLARADVLVVPADQERTPFEKLGKPLWFVSRRLVLPKEMPQRPLALAGIAKPERFFSDLRSAGVQLAATYAVRDHHHYSEADANRIRAAAEKAGADGVVTTQKDLMNLGRLVHHLGCVAIPILEMQLADADACLDFMLRTIAARRTVAS